VECEWDWQVWERSEREFTVVFPSQDTLKMSAWSGKLFMPLHDVTASIRLALADPVPVEKLQDAWVAISGLPRCMRRTDHLRVGMRMLGRPLLVFEESIKGQGPVRMLLACRNPEKLNGVVQLFHKSLGYSVGIKVVGDPRLGSTSSPPPPPPRGPADDLDDDDEDSGGESLSEGEWCELGKKDAERAARSAQAAPKPASKAGGEAAKDAALDALDVLDSPLDLLQECSGIDQPWGARSVRLQLGARWQVAGPVGGGGAASCYGLSYPLAGRSCGAGGGARGVARLTSDGLFHAPHGGLG
jgi:hypothetical protein